MGLGHGLQIFREEMIMGGFWYNLAVAALETPVGQAVIPAQIALWES